MFNIFEHICIASSIAAQPIPSLVLGVDGSAQSAKMVKHPGSRKLEMLAQLIRRHIAESSTDEDSGEVSSTRTIVDSDDRKKKQTEQEKRQTKREKRKKAKQEKRQAKRAGLNGAAEHHAPELEDGWTELDFMRQDQHTRQ